MANPVSNSHRFIIQPMDQQATQEESSSKIEPPRYAAQVQKSGGSLERELAQRDVTISQQAQTIHKLMTQNDQLRGQIRILGDEAEQQKTEKANLDKMLIDLSRDVQRYTDAKVVPLPPASSPQEGLLDNVTLSDPTFGQKLKDALNEAYQLCRQHRVLIQAGTLTIGALSAFVASAYAIPIGMLTTAIITFFQWMLGQSK
jgi:hypothetical protein